jgi:long-chain acyl-CoA synthetase
MTEFQSLPALLNIQAAAAPGRTALVDDRRSVSRGELGQRIDAIAGALQRAGTKPGDFVAILAANSATYVELFLGILRAGAAAVPLPVGATTEQLAAMVGDAGPRLLFGDLLGLERLGEGKAGCPVVSMDDDLSAWIADAGPPLPVAVQPQWAFNVIYSSGTTGAPKGIVQPHSLRWVHIERAGSQGYDRDSVAIVAVPMYSNTALAGLFAVLAYGGKAVVMPKFDVGRFLQLAARHRVSHVTLVPVMYQRVVEHPDFDKTDLSTFKYKMSSGSHFPLPLKRAVLERWPGRLLDLYGMTEGGVSTALDCTAFPRKLHTVGRPAADIDLRLIDDDGHDVPAGQPGEIVGRSIAMMSGYHNRPEATRGAEWFDEAGRRYIRSGDIGRLDEDGFVQLLDRRKDMIISGGFNIYPVDLERVLREHESVRDVAVVGGPSLKWGETPVAFVVAPGQDANALLHWANDRLGRMQRLSELRLVEDLPRNAAGKVLKRELRDRLSEV